MFGYDGSGYTIMSRTIGNYHLHVEWIRAHLQETYPLDTVQDFLIKLGITPRLHILKISILSLNHVIVIPTKTMNNLLKVCKICTFKVNFWHQKSTESFGFFFCKEYLTKIEDQLL